MNFFKIIVCLFSILIITSCEKEETYNTDSSEPDSSKMEGTWVRYDGQTYLKLAGTVAKTCNNGTETIGTYDSSVPSITFVTGGDTYVSELRMQGEKLIVKTPSQGTDTHFDTEYNRSTTWPCSPPVTGYFAIKLYTPTGSCATSGSETSTPGLYKGTLTAYYYYKSTEKYSSSNISAPYDINGGQTDAQGHYYYGLYDDYESLYKIEWNFYPNRTSYPDNCILTGSSVIDTQGQTKEVVISW